MRRAFSVVVILSMSSLARADEPKLKALIVDGHSSHGWQVTTPILKKILEASGRFTVS